MLRELSEKWLCKDEAKLIQLDGYFIVVDAKLPQRKEFHLSRN